MPDNQFPNNLEYRQEVLGRFFGYIRSTESFYLVGASSMGKTRLLDFLMNADVQKHYLADQAENTLLIRVDMNRRVHKQEDWTFYELLLSSIFLELGKYEDLHDLRAEVVRLDSLVIDSHDLLVALRFFELTVNKLRHEHGKRVAFVFDEFDETYAGLPKEIFAQLRATRDANKKFLSYAVFLRNLPDRLRPSIDNESFYELLSRNMLGIGPYTRIDALQILQQMEAQKDFMLTQELREKFYIASGGHPGLLLAFVGMVVDNASAVRQIENANWLDWLSSQDVVVEECRKIWEGLSPEEREGLIAIAQKMLKDIAPPVGKVLLAKGLIQHAGGEVKFFSHLFEQYVKRAAA